MLEKNTIVYLEPSKFPSRRSDLASEKSVKEITLDSTKTLKLADRKQDLSCDTHSELLLIQALQRRALALDLVGVASYAEVEKYKLQHLLALGRFLCLRSCRQIDRHG